MSMFSLLTLIMLSFHRCIQCWFEPAWSTCEACQVLLWGCDRCFCLGAFLYRNGPNYRNGHLSLASSTLNAFYKFLFA